MILATIKQNKVIKRRSAVLRVILVQEVDPEKGHLICLTRKGSFQVILYKNDQISIREIKGTHETGQNIKNSIFC